MSNPAARGITLHPSSLQRVVGTPHSSGFASLTFGAFSIAVLLVSFYERIKHNGRIQAGKWAQRLCMFRFVDRFFDRGQAHFNLFDSFFKVFHFGSFHKVEILGSFFERFAKGFFKL
jgi:hypothetical protein